MSGSSSSLLGGLADDMAYNTAMCTRNVRVLNTALCAKLMGCVGIQMSQQLVDFLIEANKLSNSRAHLGQYLKSLSRMPLALKNNYELEPNGFARYKKFLLDKSCSKLVFSRSNTLRDPSSVELQENGVAVGFNVMTVGEIINNLIWRFPIPSYATDRPLTRLGAAAAGTDTTGTQP